MPFDFKKEYRELYYAEKQAAACTEVPTNELRLPCAALATRTRTAVHISRPSAYCMPWPTR